MLVTYRVISLYTRGKVIRHMGVFVQTECIVSCSKREQTDATFILKKSPRTSDFLLIRMSTYEIEGHKHTRFKEDTCV